MARMLCVLGMIFVHVPDGLDGTPVYAFGSGSLGFFLEGFLVEGPGRASAALLSVVSGYLAGTTLLRSSSSVLNLYRRRFLSVVVPMIIWASITWVVYFLVSLNGRPTFVSDAQTLLDHLNIVFFLTEMPMGATMHLGFLRDLFVCVLLSPLLLPAVQRMWWLLLPLLFIFYLVEHDQSAGIILRPLILFAFTLGLFLASRRVNLRALDGFFPVFIVLAATATAVIMLVNGGAAAGIVNVFANYGMQFNETVLYPIGRLFGSLAIWTFLPVMMGGRLQKLVTRFSPYLFAAFCSHYLVLTLLFFGGWMPIFGERESPFFIVWFLAAPLTSMFMAVVIVHIALRIAPPVATVITGGRMESKAGTPMAQRRRQGVSLGFWVSAIGVWAGVSSSFAGWARGWFEMSRRLLLGRR